MSLAGPLRGFKVLDLSRILAGPYCTMMLGDMGADVIKVESLQGDDTRQWGPPFVRGESTYFLSVNRNKRSICIDLKSRRGVELVHRLAARSDVVVENFKPGDADRLGIGYAQLSQTNRSLVYGAVTGFGNRGEDRDRLAYDMFISAYGGLMSITGGPGPEPAKVGVAITDVTTGMLLCNAVVAALLQRDRTPDKVGQRIDTSLFEAQLSALVNVASATLIADAPPKRYGTAHPSIVPYQVFHAKDSGHIAVGALNDHQHVRLLGALRSALAGDAGAAAPLQFLSAPQFASNKGRVERRDEYLAQLQALLLLRAPRDWQRVFDGAQVPCTPVNSVKEAFNLPQAKALDMVVELDHPTVGRIKQVGMPVKMSATPWSARFAPPTLGQHTDEILQQDLQCSDGEIAALRLERVVQ
jgi:crotonobetainyl-CoA:carnitine CoA-transferase CaiB-like acyl-CoA transferase